MALDTSDLAARANDLLERLLTGKPLEMMGTALSLESQDTLYPIAVLHYQQAKYDDAMRLFGFLLTANHVDRRFLMGMGACLQMQRKHEDAMKFYGPASLLDLTDPEPVMRAVECYLALGNRDQARTGLDYGLKQAKYHARHNGWVDRFETMLSFMDNPPGNAPLPPTKENANV